MKDGGNCYAYCWNDPVNFVDPSGYVTPKDDDKLAKGEISKEQYDVIKKYTALWDAVDQNKDLSSDAKKIAKDLIHQQADNFRKGGYKLPKNDHSRPADFYSLSINGGSLVGVTYTFTVDKYGKTYFGSGGNVGKSLTFVSGSFTYNWIMVPKGKEKEIKPNLLIKYCTGWSYNLSGGFGAGGGVTWSVGQPYKIGSFGIFSPQIGGSITESDTTSNMKNKTPVTNFNPVYTRH